MKNSNLKTFRFNLLSILLLISVFSIFSASDISAQVPGTEKFDTYIENAMKDWKIPGLTIAILKDDEIVFAKGYGVKEMNKTDKVDKYTIFPVASNSKAFTAAILGMLVEEGKITWDSKVIDHLRDFRMYDPYITADITVRDLLTHRSGLQTFGGDHLWLGSVRTRKDILHRIRFLKPKAPFRTQFLYQNLMFLAAGMTAEAVTGKSWDDLVKERIFEPLGMKESFTRFDDRKNADNIAIPHEICNGIFKVRPFDHVDGIAPAAAINSNVIEMVQWMRLNINKGTIDGKRILQQSTMTEMQREQFSGYGLGWGVSEYSNHKVVRHGGGLTGMQSLQFMIPDIKLGVVVLTNFIPHALTTALAFKIADHYLENEDRDWHQIFFERNKKRIEREIEAEKELLAKQIKGTKPRLALEKYTGKYHNPLSGEATVTMKDGKLYFYYNDMHKCYLEHWNYDTFRIEWIDGVGDMPPKTFMSFYLDEFGNVTELKTTFYEPIYFKRVNE